MIKFLFNNFSGMPVIGGPIKAAYVGLLVKDLVQQGKNSPAKDELTGLGKNELESALKSQANDMFDQHIGPVISQHNIPSVLTNPIKDKAIDELVSQMRTKIEAKAAVIA
ncbi:hypothetical protein BH11BAC7_BH11BAC7_36210 [soil metagenome]